MNPSDKARLTAVENDAALALARANAAVSGGTANPMTSNLNANGFKISNLGAPTAPGDAATKSYVDTKIGAEESTFVVDPLGVIGGNVYNTLAQAAAAAATVNGPITYFFKNPTIVPAGSYALSPNGGTVTFVGGSTQTSIDLQDGVLFTGQPPTIFQSCSVLVRGTGANSPIQLSSTSVIYLFVEHGAAISATGSAPFINATGTASPQLFLLGTVIQGPTIKATGGTASWLVVGYDASNITSNTLALAGGAAGTVGVEAGATVSLTQAGIPGGLLVVNSTLFYGASASQINATDAAPAYGSVIVQGQLDEAKRCLASIHAESGVIASIAAPTTLATLAAIDINAQESLVIDASMVVNKDATPGAVEMLIQVDGVTVGPNLGTASTSVGANESCTIARTIQVKPAVGSRVVRIQAISIAGDGSLLAGGATVIARRVLA